MQEGSVLMSVLEETWVMGGWGDWGGGLRGVRVEISFVNTLACISVYKSKWISNVSHTNKAALRTQCRQKPSRGHVTLKLCRFALKCNQTFIPLYLPRERLHPLSFPLSCFSLFFPVLSFLFWMRVMAAHFVSNKGVERASKAKCFLRSSHTSADKDVHVQTRALRSQL